MNESKSENTGQVQGKGGSGIDSITNIQLSILCVNLQETKVAADGHAVSMQGI
jgi:hypothetical protein